MLSIPLSHIYYINNYSEVRQRLLESPLPLALLFFSSSLLISWFAHRASRSLNRAAVKMRNRHRANRRYGFLANFPSYRLYFFLISRIPNNHCVLPLHVCIYYVHKLHFYILHSFTSPTRSPFHPLFLKISNNHASNNGKRIGRHQGDGTPANRPVHLYASVLRFSPLTYLLRFLLPTCNYQCDLE